MNSGGGRGGGVMYGAVSRVPEGPWSFVVSAPIVETTARKWRKWRNRCRKDMRRDEEIEGGEEDLKVEVQSCAMDSFLCSLAAER